MQFCEIDLHNEVTSSKFIELTSSTQNAICSFEEIQSKFSLLNHVKPICGFELYNLLNNA